MLVFPLAAASHSVTSGGVAIGQFKVGPGVGTSRVRGPHWHPARSFWAGRERVQITAGTMGVPHPTMPPLPAQCGHLCDGIFTIQVNAKVKVWKSLGLGTLFQADLLPDI